MHKTAAILVSLALIVVGFCGCDNGDSEELPINNVHEITDTTYSTDEVTVNDLCINLLEFEDGDVFSELQIKFTSEFDFDCSDIAIEVNLLDENNDIIENTYATLDNVRSGESGDATVTLDGDTDLSQIKAIEICSYNATTQNDDDNTYTSIEGTFTKTLTFDIKDISINTITD